MTKATNPLRVHKYSRLLIHYFFIAIGFCFFYNGPLQAKPASILVKGVDKLQAQNIIAHIGPIEQSQLTDTNTLKKQSSASALKAMQAFGFFEPAFSYTINKNNLTILVVLGPATKTQSVNVEINNNDKELSELKDAKTKILKLRGQTFSSQQYQQAKNHLLSTATKLGYLDATYTKHQVLIDRELNIANIHLSLATGRRYHFGPFSHQGSAINETLINKWVSWRVGERYDANKILELQKRLLDSGFFKSVILKQQKDPLSAQLAVHGVFKMANANRINIGAGFGTDTGPRVKLGWQKPWINKKGHSTDVGIGKSEVRSYLASQYKIPRYKINESFWQINFNVADEDYEDTTSVQQNIGLSYVRPLTKNWKASFTTKYALEQFTQGNENGRSELLIPGVGFSFKQTKGGLVPYAGKSITFNLEAANDSLLSDASFVRAVGHARWIVSRKKHRLYSGLQLGGIYLYDSSELSDIPSSLRFFAGGDQSIRGYDYKSLSPQDSSGELTGGQYLGLARLEYAYQFHRSWRAALFVDGGSAFNRLDDRFYYGPGFGIHWLSPIGAIRFDIGFAASDDNGVRLHINLGPEL